MGQKTIAAFKRFTEMVLKMMYNITHTSVLILLVSVRPIPFAVTLQPALNTLELTRKLQQPSRPYKKALPTGKRL